MSKRFYGGRGTIHKTGYLDIEIDGNSNVIAVWFRCQPLPFRQHRVDEERASEMTRMYEQTAPEISEALFIDSKLTGFELEDPDPSK